MSAPASRLWLALQPTAAGDAPGASGPAELERIAHWALELSAQVTPEPPDAVLLEIGGSLRLFGGYEAIERQAHHGLAELGYTARTGCAPTPLGACLLARAGVRPPVRDRAALRRALAPLPCDLLDPTPAQRSALSALGATTLGDCLRLPRAGLRRRMGPDLAARLERAVGERADPRRGITPPRHHTDRLELPAPSASEEALGFAVQRLLRGLAGVLRSHDAGVQDVTIRLAHADRPPTPITLGFLRPTRDAAYMTHIARHRLAREHLPEPAHAVVLEAPTLLPYHGTTESLLAGGPHDPNAIRRLMERLAARLGPERAGCLAPVADPRPERAWRRVPLSALDAAPPSAPAIRPLRRPAWLLPSPQQLHVAEGRPCWQRDPLQIDSGPERIESGWWDGDDVCRDYYLARASQGSRLWVFQERRPPYRWFLHGFLG